MVRKRVPRPMDSQPAYHNEDLAMPMAPAPTQKTKAVRMSGPAISDSQAETTRRRSLKKQRSEMENARKR